MADVDRIDPVIIHASELVTCAGDDPGEIGIEPDGAIAIVGERIVQVGTTADVSTYDRHTNFPNETIMLVTNPGQWTNGR